MMKAVKIYSILFSLCLMLGLSSCIEDRYLDSADTVVGEGESMVSFGVTYHPAEDTQLATRGAAGDAIKTIEDLNVVWYNEDGSFFRCEYIPKDQFTVSTEVDRTDAAMAAGLQAPGETTTHHVEFKCAVPYGKYRIYSVANMGGDLSAYDWVKSGADGKTAEQRFRSQPFGWNLGSSVVTTHDQMSGYFTLKPNASTTPAMSVENVKATTPPLLLINQAEVHLHSWMRRLASKVTVAFDASNLNENVYIYLRSAQIKDIPQTCTLVDSNTPTNPETDLWSEGDIIEYGSGPTKIEPGDYTYQNWPRLSRGRGANTYGSDHSNAAEALFFYENMQGTHPNKHLYQNFEKKDNVPCGTYLEVKAYYVNNTPENPSFGNIIYRCMLGKDMEEDFNCERNAHYKVTLKFKNDANNPDWHIEYDYKSVPPEIVVPSPMYISYLSNQSLDIPVTVNHAANVSVVSVTAEIIKNDWGFRGHKYDGTNTAFTNGFLSLDLINQTNIGDRVNEYTGKKTFTDKTAESTTTSSRFNVPVYTRPMTLGSGFSGNNIYVGQRRYAQVRISVTLSNGAAVEPKVVDVIQVRRLVNPTGIWRKANSQKPFHVVLKVSPLSSTEDGAHFATTYENQISDGPWTATIDKETEEWIEIKDSKSDTWGRGPVTGATGSVVEFDFRPASTNVGKSPRFGRIKVTYHNNTCVHMICVSQGMGTVNVAGKYWMMSNVKYNGVDEVNPLLEGGMFKFGNATVAFTSVNSLKPEYGPFQTDRRGSSYPYEAYNNSTWNNTTVFNTVNINTSGFNANTTMTANGMTVATDTDWALLIDYPRYYGVLYGDNSSESLSNEDATTYTYEEEDKGMRGVFVYDTSRNTHLFLPIGNTGYGRRQEVDDYYSTFTTGRTVRYGVLKYADRTIEMPTTTAQSVPTLYNLWKGPGTVYWYGNANKTGANGYNGFDINYLTYGFEPYTMDHVYESTFTTVGITRPANKSDACFIRRISTKPIVMN